MKKSPILSKSISSLLAIGALAALPTSPYAYADFTWTGGGASTNWSDANNWGGVGPTASPANFGTLTFTTGGTQGTTSVDDIASLLNGNELLWTGTSAWTLNASGSTIRLFDNGGVQAKIENQSTGLVTINAPITFAATAGAAWGEINAVNGDITFGSGTLTVNGSQVSYIKMFGSGHTTTFNNSVSASGKAFYTTGPSAETIAVGGAFTSGDIFIMNDSTLNLNSSGSITTSQLRLGGDFGTTLTQNQALGATFALTNLTGSQSFTNGINAVASNTSGALLIDSQNTSGTNTINSVIALDSALKIQLAAGAGALALTGGNVDVKAQTLTMSVGSGATTTVNEVLGSSLAAGGSLIKTGAGTLILQGTANNYTGTSAGSLNANGTQIASGTLGIYGDTSLGVAPTGPYNNIQFTGSGTLQDTANNITLSANRNISIAGGSTATFDSNGNTFTIGGIISGGTVTKIGAGTLVLSGANSYTGGTNINAGTLTISSDGNLGGTGVANGVSLNGGTLNTGSNLITLNANHGITVGANGGTIVNIGTGANLFNFNSTNTLSGSGALQLQGNSGTNDVFQINAAQNISGLVSVNNTRLQFTNAAATLGTSDLLEFNGVSELYLSTGATLSNRMYLAGSNSDSRGALRITAASTLSGNIIVNTNASISEDAAITSTFSNAITGGATVQFGGVTGSNASAIYRLTGNSTVNGLTIGNGTVQLGDGTTTGTLSANTLITNNGTFAINRSNAVVQGTDFAAGITGTGGLTLAGTNTVTLSGTNTFGGATTLAAGNTLVLNSALADAGGTITPGTGTIQFATAAGTAFTVGGLTGSANLSMQNVSGASITLSLGNVTNTYTGVLSNGTSGTANLTKIGSGTFTLGKAATYSGTTTINQGNLFNGLNTTGVLKLDFNNAAASATNLINNTALVLGGDNSSNATTILGGGQLLLTGKNSTTNSQAFTGTTVGTGFSQVVVTNTATANPLSVNLNAITRQAGGVVDFTLNANGTNSAANGLATSSGTASSLLVDANGTAYATVGGNDWAAKDATNAFIITATTAGLYTTANSAATFSGNADITGSFSATSDSTVNTIRMNTGTPTLTLVGTNTISAGGILFGSGLTTAATAATITGGTIRAGAGKELVFTDNKATLNSFIAINSIIADSASGASSVTYRAVNTTSLGGEFQLGAQNTYTGPTYLLSGRVFNSTTNSQPFGNGGNVYINGNTNAQYYQQGAATVANHFYISGSGWNETGGGPFGAIRVQAGTISGQVTLLGNATISGQGGTGTFSGVIDDGGNGYGLTINNGTVVLTNAETYTGTTTITAGTLQLGNGTTDGSINNTSVISAGTLNFNNVTSSGNATYTGRIFGGTVTKSTAGTLTLNSANNSVATLNLSNAGAIIDIGSNNLTLTNSGNSAIASTTGGTINASGGGTITLSHLGVTDGQDIGTTGGTLTINAKITGAGMYENWSTANSTGVTVLTGANDYAGNTIINAGVLSVSSIGNQYSTTSNLGQGNTISISSVASGAQNSTLKYTGTGETTNRIINFWLAGTSGGIIDQSGASGLLKFTNDLTVTNTGTKTLTLQGSAAGTGEFAGVIGNGSGGVAVTKAGTGTWTLSGANTYSGTTTISAGTLDMTGTNSSTGGITLTGGTLVLDNATNGGLASGTFSFNGGTLQAGTTTRSISNAITLDAATNTASGSQNVNLTGTVTLQGAIVRALTSSITGGNTLTLSSVRLSDAQGTARELTINGSGNTTINALADSAAGVTSGTLSANGLVLNQTAGTLTLANANTYTGHTTLTAGTLVLGNKAAFGTSAVTLNGISTTSVFASTDLSGANAINNAISTTTSGGIATFTGSNNIELSGAVAANVSHAITNNISGSGKLLTLSGGLSLASAATNFTTTINGTGNTLINSIISGGTSAGAGSLTYGGSGMLTLSGSNTYAGATTVSGGTLALGNGGNLGATVVTVSNAGSTFKIAQNASGTSNALTGSLSLGTGTAFTMADGFTSTFNVTGASTLVAAVGTSTLGFNIGGVTTSVDLLAIGSAVTMGAGGASTINMTQVGATALTVGNYTLISATGGLGTSAFFLGTTNFFQGGSLFHYSLANSTSAAEVLTVATGGAGTASAFWTGSQSTSSWATVTGGTSATNFSTDAAGTTNTLGVPDLNTNVTFTATSAANLSTTLDQNFTINSLSFSGTGTSNTAGSTIASGSGTNTLTINGLAVSGNTAGNGITVASGSGANTISAKVALGASQTWTNNSANSLTVSGDLSGPTFGLTKAGTGTVVLSGTNSYSGATAISAGTLEFQGAGAMGSSSALSMSSGATLGLKADADTTFAPSGSLTLDNGTFNFQVNSLNSPAGDGHTLTLNGQTGGSANATTNINVSSTTGDTLKFGTSAAFVIGANSSSAFGGPVTNFALTNANVILNGVSTTGTGDGQFSVSSATGNTLTLNGVVTLLNTRTVGATVNSGVLTLNNTVGGTIGGTNNGFFVTLAGGTLNLNNAGAINTNAASGNGGGAGLKISGGTLNNTSGAAKTLTSIPTVRFDGDFAFSTAGGTSANDLNLGTGVTSLGVNAGATRTITTNGSATLTIGGIISNGTNGTTPTINLIKAGTGTLKLTNTNLYTGTTAIQAGALAITNNSAMGAGAVTLGDATVGANATLTGNLTTTVANNITVASGSGTRTIGGTNGGGSAATLSGTVTLNNNLIINEVGGGSNGDLVLTGVVSGTGNITVDGGSTGFGRAKIGNASNSIVGDLTLQNNATLFTVNGALGSGNAVTIDGTSQLNTSGASLTIAGLSGTGTVVVSNSSSQILTVGGSGTYNYGGVISNVGGLTKSGAGTQTLSGANTYSGLTTVSNGTLALSGGAAIADAGAVSLANAAGATLLLNNSETIGSLAGGGVLGGTVSLGANALTTGDASTTTFAGALSGAGGQVTKQGAGTFNITGPQTYAGLTTTGGVTNIYTALGTGTSTLTANATTHIYASQTLASLTIGSGTTVTFGDGLPFAPAAEKFGAPAALVPEPGSLGLLMLCALGILGRRQRAA